MPLVNLSTKPESPLSSFLAIPPATPIDVASPTLLVWALILPVETNLPSVRVSLLSVVVDLSVPVWSSR